MGSTKFRSYRSRALLGEKTTDFDIRETVTSVWTVAHKLGGGKLCEKTMRKGISPITFEVTVSLV